MEKAQLTSRWPLIFTNWKLSTGLPRSRSHLVPLKSSKEEVWAPMSRMKRAQRNILVAEGGERTRDPDPAAPAFPG